MSGFVRQSPMVVPLREWNARVPVSGSVGLGANDDYLRGVAADERFLPTFSYYGKQLSRRNRACDERVARAEEAPYPFQNDE